MKFKMSDLIGVNRDHAAKLLAAGIENTDEMMRVWNDPALRASVTASTGIEDEQLTRLVSMARMARMKGVGPKYADLLVTAGVTGSRSLSAHTPETLVKHLSEVNAATRRTGPVPTLAVVGTWFAELKSVPE